jgi:hypothetical protein
VDDAHGDGNGDGARSNASHWFAIAGGRLRASDEAHGQATARVEGDEAAWIAALGPRGDRSGLRFSGRRSIAQRILDSLPRNDRL